MASDSQETLYKIFADLSGGIAGGGAGSGLATTVAGASGGGAVGGLASTVAGAVGAAVTGSKAGEESGASGAARVAMSVVKSGLGVVPMVAALFGLFGGGDDDEKPAPLVKYALPARREFQAAVTERGFAAVDYDQWGMVREERGTARDDFAAAAPGPERGGTPATTQVHVNVQAMDARSFLDRSGEIAAAVREAMLNLNSINDVVQDL